MVPSQRPACSALCRQLRAAQSKRVGWQQTWALRAREEIEAVGRKPERGKQGQDRASHDARWRRVGDQEPS
eukprot:1866163-Rhodomonas_salina.1